MSLKLVAVFDDDGTVPCGSCNANWSVPLIAELHRQKRLRAEGFAFIDFDGEAVLINLCPHCDLPASTTREVTWPSLLPLN